MVKKLQKLNAEKKSSPSFAESVKASAQQIWLAGLGAFAKAEEGRGKVFETLAKEGLNIQRRTQAVAEEKISEAASRLAGMTSGFTSKANDFTSLATGQWDKLENIFEDRVAKALNKLGVPTSVEVAALVTRIDELNKSVQKLASGKVAAAPKTVVSPRAVVPKGAVAKKAVVKAGPVKAADPKKAAPKVAAVKKSTAPKQSVVEATGA